MSLGFKRLTRWWCVLAEFDIGGELPLCSAGRRGGLVIQRVWCGTKCSLSERRSGGQSIALPSRGEVRLSMRQVEMTVKLLTGRVHALWMT